MSDAETLLSQCFAAVLELWLLTLLHLRMQLTGPHGVDAKYTKSND